MILPEQSFLSKPTDVIAGFIPANQLSTHSGARVCCTMGPGNKSRGDTCKYCTAPETLPSLAKQGMEDSSYPAGPLLRSANRYWKSRPWCKRRATS